MNLSEDWMSVIVAAILVILVYIGIIGPNLINIKW